MLKKIIAGLMCLMLLAGCTAQSTPSQEITYSEEATNEKIIYVNVENTSSGDGDSWDNAFSSLQDALSVAEENDEIWVAKGTYFPSENDSSVSFEMKDDVSIYGGFNGDETSRDERDWEANETILSGDIGVINVLEDNSTHVVIAANGVLDGFTISDGYIAMPGQGGAPKGMDGPPKGQDGPPSNNGSRNVGHSTPEQVLSGDASTSVHGAGIIIWEAAPTIANCTITDNSAGKGGGVYIVNTGGAGNLPIFLNSTISNNYAVKRGAGVALDQRGDAIFIDCIFSNNVCDEKGGAIYHDFGSSAMFENCLFVNNKAGSGAAFGNDGTSSPVISSSTLYGNEAWEAGAALYQGTGPYNDPSVINTIVWGNICDEDEESVYNWNECNPKIDYSLIEGGYVGEGIIDADPLFVDPGNMNFDLQANSPCLTASSDGGRIGFDASLVDQRTEDEYKSLIENLYNIEFNEDPTVLDLANPVDSEDATNIESVIYVDAGIDEAGDGSSWNSAFDSLQDAINYANAAYQLNGDEIEVWVAKDTYYTGEERSDSFILREGVHVYGGFAGTETDLEDRDYEGNATILSGDIGVLNDVTDNSYHVVIGSDDTILDGFTITGGNADKEDGGEVYDNKGGGLLNYAAGNRVRPSEAPVLGFDTVVRNCSFEDNYAVEGAASYTYHGANPVFENCEFSNNTAVYGGAVLDRAGVNSKYIECAFEENIASFKGGAAFVDYGSMATFEDCTFDSNSSGTAGGAIYVIDRASQATPNETDFDLIDDTWPEALLNDIFSSVLIKNSSFENNKAGTNGGAMYVYEGSFAKVVNTAFDDNDADQNGDDIGIFLESTLYLDDNSIFTSTEVNSIYIEDESQVMYE